MFSPAAILGQPFGQESPPGAIVNLNRVRGIPFILAAVVGVLAVISFGHLMFVAVRRRRREMATLQAFGAWRGWLSAVVHWQATFMTCAVLVVALPLGSIIGSTLCRRFMSDVGARPDTVQPVAWLAVAAWPTSAVASW